MADRFGDAADELLRRIDKLEVANGKLCEEINRQERLIERMRRLIKALFISHGFMCGLAGMDEDEFERVVLAKWVDRLRDVGIEVDE